MTWSHNDMWMLTADHGGYVKYWQSNMNNVKMFQAHKEAIREARFLLNLPLFVVKPSLCFFLLERWGRHMLLLLLWLINDRCKCVLLQHWGDLLLMFCHIADELFVCQIKSSIIGSELDWDGPVVWVDTIRINQSRPSLSHWSIKFTNKVNKDK